MTSTIKAFNRTRPVVVYVYDAATHFYYVQHGGFVVNSTFDDVVAGCDINQLHDIDTFTWKEPIFSEEQLVNAII